MEESEHKLEFVVRYVLQYIEEICQYTDDFNTGQKYALVDLLEAIQRQCTVKERLRLGIDWRIEDRYPL